MPIPLGVLAVAGAGAAAAGSYELIQTQLISTNTASVSFSSLNTAASTYKHLQIRATWKTSGTATDFRNLLIRFAGDTSATYASHSLLGNGSAVSSSSSASQTSINLLGLVPTSSSGQTNIFGASVIDILDWNSASTKNITLRSLDGFTGNVSRVQLGSGLFYFAYSYSSISLEPSNSESFVSGTRISLYGIK